MYCSLDLELISSMVFLFMFTRNRAQNQGAVFFEELA